MSVNFNHLGMEAEGLVPYEVPGIEGYYTLRVPYADGIYQIDIRRLPEPASHTMPEMPAEAATREDAAVLMSRMFIACLAGQGRDERRGRPVGKRQGKAKSSLSTINSQPSTIQ